MSEERYEIRQYGVRYRCACGSGHLVYSPDAVHVQPFGVGPRTYPHTCDKCGQRRQLAQIYPAIRIEEVKP